MVGTCQARDVKQMHAGFLWKTLKERDRLEILEVDGRIILILKLNKWDG
jgi:hypothetical protein